jgi:hypothetical protein
VFEAKSELTVAGRTNPVTLTLAVQPKGAAGITISTTKDLKMTDFGVVPPTAMLGVNKAGDAITVRVVWELKAAPSGK